MYENIFKFNSKNCISFYNEKGDLIKDINNSEVLKLNDYYELLCLLNDKLKLVIFDFPSLYAFSKKIILIKSIILLKLILNNYNFIKNPYEEKNSFLVFNDKNFDKFFIYILFKEDINNINKKLKNYKYIVPKKLILKIYKKILFYKLLGYKNKILKGLITREYVLFFSKKIKNIKFNSYSNLYDYLYKNKKNLIIFIKNESKIIIKNCNNFLKILKKKLNNLKNYNNLNNSYYILKNNLKNNFYKISIDEYKNILNDNIKDKKVKKYVLNKINKLLIKIKKLKTIKIKNYKN